MSGNRQPFTVVIPAYNEAATIADVVRRARAVAPDVLVVDDGSQDGTPELAEAAGARVLRHACNEGKGASLWDGLQEVARRGGFAVTLDGDGQHAPEDIPRMLEVAGEPPAALVLATRVKSMESIPPGRRRAQRFADFWISWAAGLRLRDTQTGFRLYPSDLLKRLGPRPTRADGFVFESAILIRAAHAGIPVRGVPIQAVYPPQGRPSHYRPLVDSLRITRMVAGALLRRGLHPQGFWKAFISPRIETLRRRGLDMDGILMLLVSCLVMVLGAGLTLGISTGLVIATGRRAPVSATTDTLAVMGFNSPHGLVSGTFSRRLRRALILWRPGIRIFLVGGARPGAQVTEARLGQEWLAARGVHKADIRLEEESTHTLDNLRRLRTMVGPCRVTIVSSRYHLYRLHLLASGLALRHELCAAEDRWRWSPSLAGRAVLEGFYVHWYLTGRTVARLLRSSRLLRRIT